MNVFIMGNNDHMGGLTVHYITLAKYLKKAGHRLFCININDTGEQMFSDPEIKEFVIPYRATSLLQKTKKYFLLKTAINSAKQFNPDLFIATGYGQSYIMAASALPSSTFKFFEEVHFDAHEVDLKLKMVECFDAIAPQTKGMEKIFKSNISAKKPVSYLPCFSKEYHLKTFSDIPFAGSMIRLAYFGRLASNKGISQFISATWDIFEGKNLILDIYGKGPEEPIIKQEIINRNLQDKIKLVGFYQDAEFPALISSYHGIIIPSIDTEGLPLILIEAMRYGRPVLCTTTGAMPEVAQINQQGMIVSKKDAESLHESLVAFTDSLQKKEFSAEVIHSVYLNHFSNASFWQKWERMLENPRGYFTNKVIETVEVE